MSTMRSGKDRRTKAARAAAAVLAVGLLAGCTGGGTATTPGQSGTTSAVTTLSQATSPGVTTIDQVTTPGSTTTGTAATQPGETGDLIFARDARQLVQDRLAEDGFIKEIEFDHEGSRYEGEALIPGKKINFVLNARTGEFDRWRERDSDEHSQFAPYLAEIITMDEAADLVIGRSGQPNTFIRDIELDFDFNVLQYEGEAFNSGVEYDFEIDAKTGEFREWDEERSSDWERYYSNMQ